MDERARRVGRNEALFRQVNEELEALERGLAYGDDATIEIVCECGDLRCTDRIGVPVPVYERVRADGSLFIVLTGHEIPAAEDIVEQNERFVIVRKREGGPRELAEATDPRG
jgi:hypothetical protein